MSPSEPSDKENKSKTKAKHLSKSTSRRFPSMAGMLSLTAFSAIAVAEIAWATRGFTHSSLPPPMIIPERFHTALFTINVTIAVFAANFSFIAYQFSPYRALLRKISGRQVLAAGTTLLAAILPIAILVIEERWAPTAAVLALPFVSLASILLNQLASSEVDPDRLISRAASSRRILNFKSNLIRALSANEIEVVEKGPQGIEPRPTHEFGWKHPPDVSEEDPFGFLASFATISVSNSDIGAFERALVKTLEAMSLIAGHPTYSRPKRSLFKKKSSVSNSSDEWENVLTHAASTLERIGIIARENDKTDTFSSKYLNKCTSFLLQTAFTDFRQAKLAFAIFGAMMPVAKHLIRKNQLSVVIAPIIAARQLAAQAVRLGRHKNMSGEDMESFIFSHAVPGYASIIEQLGEEAADVGSGSRSHSDYFYRCLDALGWLGCTSVKNDHTLMGKECLQGLVQLGRRARARNMECFWSRCALSPFDHALERIEWIASWIPSLDASARDRWVEMIVEACSRLTGFRHKSEWVKEDEKLILQLIRTKEPHKIGFLSSTAIELDYSDQKMLKKFELY